MSSFDDWAKGLRGSVRSMVPGLAVDLQRRLVFLCLGAAVQVRGRRFRRISGVVLRTPVDTGRARASWGVSIGQKRTPVPPPGDYPRAQEEAMAKAEVVLAGLRPLQTVWVGSSLEYIPHLEFGLYPNPPSRGTWNPRLKRFEIRSRGGFSKQAPRGMARVTFAEIKRALR